MNDERINVLSRRAAEKIADWGKKDGAFYEAKKAALIIADAIHTVLEEISLEEKGKIKER